MKASEITISYFPAWSIMYSIKDVLMHAQSFKYIMFIDIKIDFLKREPDGEKSGNYDICVTRYL